MRQNLWGKQHWLVAAGAALALGGVCVALFGPTSLLRLFIFLPLGYAAVLAGAAFWFRAMHASDCERTFWRLLAGGCWTWTIATSIHSFTPVKSMPSSAGLVGLAFSFLPQVLLMIALVMQPEISEWQWRNPVVRYEAALIAIWWTYLYVLIPCPWYLVLPSARQYWIAYARLHLLEDVSVVLWLFAIWAVTRGPWRTVYGNLAGAIALLFLSSHFSYSAWQSRRWLATMILHALLVGAFLWLSNVGLIDTAAAAQLLGPNRKQAPTLGSGAWLASIAAIGIPILAVWSNVQSDTPEPIRRFRLVISFATLAVAMLVLYRWQDVAESQRERLVSELEKSVYELRRLQGHFAEAEKLASLGQLAAGAAHEINNPVAAILGYSELLRSDLSASGRVQEFGKKIGEQARRIRGLVHNLLSLAEQGDRQMRLIDVIEPLRGALQLRRISAGHLTQNISLAKNEGSLQVQGDPEKLLQVFYRLLLALSEDDSEARIEVRAQHEIARTRVLIEFIGRPVLDSAGATAAEVNNVQRAQQGKGLSLNVCYTIIKEHGGDIVHESLMDGGRVFRVELPAVGAAHALPSAAGL